MAANCCWNGIKISTLITPHAAFRLNIRCRITYGFICKTMPQNIRRKEMESFGRCARRHQIVDEITRVYSQNNNFGFVLFIEQSLRHQILIRDHGAAKGEQTCMRAGPSAFFCKLRKTTTVFIGDTIYVRILRVGLYS